ncbi:MAG: S26 family signal peptidase [Planctomycetia bacterium]|nr:S26 family signal peptidase [Planctomycetia bacterium]
MGVEKEKPVRRPSGSGTGTVLAAAVLVIATAAGCSKSEAPRVPTNFARGQVFLEGKPLQGALVVLHRQGEPAATTGTVNGVKAAEPAPSARGLSEADGRFTLTTYATGDGVPEGEYLVTVVQRPAQKNGESFEPGPNVLPSRYASPKTTDLRVKIAVGENELAPLALKR